LLVLWFSLPYLWLTDFGYNVRDCCLERRDVTAVYLDITIA
jgi:hypothetical protein